MDEREIKETRDNLTKTFKDYGSQEEIERFVQKMIRLKKKASLEESCKQMSERQFMLLVEFDSSWTIEEKLRFYYKNCNPEYTRETNEWRYKLMSNTMSEEEFLEKTKYDTTMTEAEKLDFYHKYHHNKY